MAEIPAPEDRPQFPPVAQPQQQLQVYEQPPAQYPYPQYQAQPPALYGQPVTLLRPPNPKSKTGAVLLAVFLAFWTWCYTYQRDSWKFWLNLVLSVLSLGLWVFVAWIWAIIDVCVKPQSWYDNFPNA